MQSNGSPSFAESEGPTSELPLDPPNPASPISSLSFSHNHVISGNETGVFSAYDIQTGTPICSYNFHQGPITSISSTVNNIVVTGGLDGRLQVYNFNTNQLNASFNENKNAITNIILNNTHKVFMSSSLDGTVKLEVECATAAPSPIGFCNFVFLEFESDSDNSLISFSNS